MVITTTLQPVASFSFRAASTAFLSSGLMMVCHGCAVQGAIGINSNLTGGIRNLLYTNNCLHSSVFLLFLLSAEPDQR